MAFLPKVRSLRVPLPLPGWRSLDQVPKRWRSWVRRRVRVARRLKQVFRLFPGQLSHSHHSRKRMQLRRSLVIQWCWKLPPVVAAKECDSSPTKRICVHRSRQRRPKLLLHLATRRSTWKRPSRCPDISRYRYSATCMATWSTSVNASARFNAVIKKLSRSVRRP